MTLNHIPLSDAIAWIEAHARPLGTEMVDASSLIGRVLAAAWTSHREWPAADQAAIDGYAIRAADSEGAGDYNPVTLMLAEGELTLGSASSIHAGATMPAAADAVLPLDAAHPCGPDRLDIMRPVACGSGVDRCGSQLHVGTPAIMPKRRIRAQDAALLAGCTVAAVRRPSVHLIVAGARAGVADLLTPMLHALVARDGGTAQPSQLTAASLQRADLVIVAGRSGVGADDGSPASIAAAGGKLDVHGIAMRPGETSGLGIVCGMPLVLLPGNPLACFVAYDMLAARAVRRMAGLRAGDPPGDDAVLARKIVSAIGFTDIVRVRVSGGRATPLGSADSGGLFSLVQADGYVVVPETSEGFAPGSVVRVHWYDDRRDQHD